MDRIKLLNYITLFCGNLALILVLVASFTSTWIEGDFESTYHVNTSVPNQKTYTNTSGSATEGIWTICTNNNTYIYTVSSHGSSTSNTTDHACGIRDKSNLPPKKPGTFKAIQGVYTVGFIDTALGILLLYLHTCVKRLSGIKYIREVNALIFYIAGILIMGAVIAVSGSYRSLTGLLNPTKGGGVTLGIVADLGVFFTAILCTIKFCLFRKQERVQSGYQSI